MARLSLRSFRPYVSKQARAKRQADRKAWRAAYEAERRAFDQLRFGKDEDYFVSVSLPSKAGTSPDGIRRAAEPHVWALARKHAQFDDLITIVPGVNSDQSNPFDVATHLEGANRIRLPADTKIFLGDKVEFGDDCSRWVTELTTVQDGERFKSFRFKDPCSSSVLTAWLNTTDHVLATWSLTSPFPTSIQPTSVAGLREDRTTEFKRKMSRDGRFDRKGDHAISKSVASLANMRGGILVIGADDRGRRIGLEEDYQLLGDGGSDAFERRLRQVVGNDLQPLDLDLLQISFENDGECEVCLVVVHPSQRPVLCRPKELGSQPDQARRTEFWIRDGNSSQRLTGTELSDYLVSDRFARQKNSQRHHATGG